MKNTYQKIANLSAHTIVLSFLSLGVSSIVQAASFQGDRVVVANRESGTLSVIDTVTDTATTIDIPFGELRPEPMYIFHVRSTKEVAVGDRANNRIVFFDQNSYEVTGTVETDNGVFHMWGSPNDTQLWINNDIDNTITVINPVNKNVLTTIAIPADLVAEEGRPHDVILDPSGDFAYVSVLGLSEDHTPVPGSECEGCDITSVLLKYSTQTFEEIDRLDVGVDPHLGLTSQNDLLYVAAQNSDVVTVLAREDFSIVKNLTVPGAHGVGIAGSSAPNGRFFYTTNLPSADGSNGLFVIDTVTNEIIDNSGFNTGFAVPHNIAVTNDNEKLYISHSIGSLNPGKVTVYDLDPITGLPVGSTPTTDINVGVNPFGIFFISGATSVAEPGSLLGLLFVSSLGISSLLKSSKIKSRSLEAGADDYLNK